MKESVRKLRAFAMLVRAKEIEVELLNKKKKSIGVIGNIGYVTPSTITSRLTMADIQRIFENIPDQDHPMDIFTQRDIDFYNESIKRRDMKRKEKEYPYSIEELKLLEAKKYNLEEGQVDKPMRIKSKKEKSKAKSKRKQGKKSRKKNRR